MISKVGIRNLKKIEYQECILSDFDLLVGTNNSGKSTVLQALAIWQFCVEQFRLAKRGGTTGIQIVLPDFTALPLPEFNLLWKDRTDRRNQKTDGGKSKPELILIEIEVFWKSSDSPDLPERSFKVQLRYNTPLSIYAIPAGGWKGFKDVISDKDFPFIVYVPPFSGLEPSEKWLDDGNVRQQVGKGQPGSVLRNLLFRVIDKTDASGSVISKEKNKDWQEIKEKIKEWFGVDIDYPIYVKGQSTQILQTYSVGKKKFDIISAGSGFHQILTLMAFLYGYPGITTILFDEPDAHLHANLQKQILSYFKNRKKNVQFLIATHSDVFIKGVDVHSILSVLSGSPKRVKSSAEVIAAMSEVNNRDVIATQESPFILYVEGEDDERILNAWASVLNKSELLGKFHIVTLGGPDKKAMLEKSKAHFSALKQINPNIKKVVLFDYDDENSFHPPIGNPVVFEWKRRNIENYLLVNEAWKLAVSDALNISTEHSRLLLYDPIIDDFFDEQNLNLRPGTSWRDVKADIFSIVNGKKILFEKSDSLFHKLKEATSLTINREKVANNMNEEMLHEDVHQFFQKLESIVSGTEST